MSFQNELSKLEQINYKQIKLMKSIYDDSYDKANKFIGDKPEDFAEYNTDSDDIIEGMKSKKKSKDKPVEEDFLNSINKGIDKNVSNTDNNILKDAFSVIMVIGLTQISWKNIIHKTTGAVDTTSFDKMIIVPVFNKIIENLKILIKGIDTAKNAYNTFKGMGNGKMFGGKGKNNNLAAGLGNVTAGLGKGVTNGLGNVTNGLGNMGAGLGAGLGNMGAGLGAGLGNMGAGLVNNILNTDDVDMFDIKKWTSTEKVTFWLILYIPLLWLSRFMIGNISDTIEWLYKVKWIDIFNWLIFGKDTGDNLFPEFGLYSPPQNPWLITVFSVYFVYLAGKVFIDYMTFWIQIPVFFLIFLCIWFGAVMYPFLNICIFIFFAATAAYTLFMPHDFYYDGEKFFPHSFMDTLNKELPGDENKGTKIFLDLTYRIFILLSAIIFIYKSFKLSSGKLKGFYASISIFFTLLWLGFTWKEFSKSADVHPEPVLPNTNIDKSIITSGVIQT